MLEGLVVVGLEQAVAAPFCTSRLADAGARVIKIERAEGDFARGYDAAANGTSSYFAWLNRGKESVVLDLKAPGDRALLDTLIGKADVFIQNFGPGATDRLGIGSATLRARHPRLITCDISSYGAEGPFADRKGYDLLIQAESGLASVTGTPEGPGRVGVSVCDIATGLNAYAGILEALIERGRTGLGSGIAVSLFDAMADWMTVPLLQAEAAGSNPARIGLNHVSIAPYGAYACADGEVMIAIQNEREWGRFCAAVLDDANLAADPRFATNGARVANRPALDAIIESAIGGLAKSDLIERLQAADVAFGAINTVLEFSAHPHLRRAKMATPTGSVSIAAPPVIRDGRLFQPGPAPAIGEHTAAIRREFQEAT